MNLRALLINLALSCALVGFLAYGCTHEAPPPSIEMERR